MRADVVARFEHEHELALCVSALSPATYLNRRHRRTVVARSPAELALALHAKVVPALSLHYVAQLLSSSDASRLDELVRSTCVCVGGKHRLKAPVADALELSRAQYCEPFLGGNSSAVDYFSVVEAHKNRRRPIFWPRSLLLLSKYKSAFTLHSVHDYRNAVHLGTHACAFDLAASFAQVELPPTSNLVFKDEAGTQWRLKRLPYGIDVAPEIMQLVVNGLAQQAKLRARVDVSLFVHIDNVMAIGDADNVSAWKTAFLDLCRSADVTLNVEPSNDVSPRVSFAGMELDFAHKQVALRDAFLHRLIQPAPQMTNQDLEGLVSRVIYAWTATGRDWHRLYFAIKWFRRRLSALARDRARWDAPADIHDGTLRSLRTAVSEIARNDWFPVPPPSRPAASAAILATDATLSGWGAVFLCPGRLPEAHGATFRFLPTNIGVAESLAALGGIARFEDALRSVGSFTLLIDNTSSQATIARVNAGKLPKGRQATGEIALAIVDKLRSWNVSMRVARIATDDNIADEVSRGRPIDLGKVKSCAAAAGLSDLLAEGD